MNLESSREENKQKATVAANTAYDLKDYAKASELYYEAIKLGAGSLDIYNRIAYALSSINNYKEAAIYYAKSLEIKKTALNYNNLGICLENIGKAEEARIEYQRAVDIEPSSRKYLKNLAFVYSKLNNEDERYKLLEKIVKMDGADSVDWSTLGGKKYARGDFEGAIEAYRNSLYRHTNPAEIFRYIGFCHKEQHRLLDAYFSFKQSIRFNPEDKYSKDKIELLNKSLDEIKKVEVRYKEYSLPSNDQYINPYSLLYFEEDDSEINEDDIRGEVDNWDQMKSLINRRKKELKAEYELNDGKVSWFPYFLITEDVAHRVLSQLDDNGWNEYHWLVFRQPLLNKFLTIGDSEYFLNKKCAPYTFAIDEFIRLRDSIEAPYPEEYIRFISPYFKNKWASLVRRMLEKTDYDSMLPIVSLFYSLLPMTISDYEEAICPLVEYSKYRIKYLDRLDDELIDGKDVNTNAVGNIGYIEYRILNAIPHDLTSKIRRDLALAYRSLAITQTNKHDKYDQSKYLLSIASGFKPDKLLQEKLKNDQKDIADLIEKDKKREEAKSSYSFKKEHKPFLGKKRFIEITPELFTADQKTVQAKDITGIAYAITINRTNGIRTGETTIVSISTNTDVIHVQWLNEVDFQSVVRSLMMLHSQELIKNIAARIKRDSYTLSNKSGTLVNFTKNGAQYTSGAFFFKKDHLIPYKDLKAELYQGDLVVSAISNKDYCKHVPMESVWNAVLMPFVIEHLK
jgi:tetratricopeptide (TPR) repeat protein